MADRESRESESKESVEVGALALITAPTPLTTPCTLQQLRNWLKGVEVLTPNYAGAVASTATTLAVT